MITTGKRNLKQCGHCNKLGKFYTIKKKKNSGTPEPSCTHNIIIIIFRRTVPLNIVHLIIKCTYLYLLVKVCLTNFKYDVESNKYRWKVKGYNRWLKYFDTIFHCTWNVTAGGVHRMFVREDDRPPPPPPHMMYPWTKKN